LLGETALLKLPIAYVSTALVFVLMDGAFLAVVGPKLYRPDIGVLLTDKVRLGPALVFYLLYVAGLVYFCVRPSLALGWTAGLINGVLLGLVAYGTYDLTCYAVMRVWTLKVTLVDLAWGAIASGVASAAGVAITRAIAMRGAS
jgi:uncharacterized membrane protein